MSDLQFLEKLITTGSPTGREQELQRYLHGWAKPFADHIESDLLGNLAVVINPGQKTRVMLAAHCDRIGFMVMEILEEGVLRVDPLGGIDEGTIQGASVVIHSEKGDVTGVIGKVSTHLQAKSDKDKTPSVDNIWIDIGAKDKADAEKRVKIGDYVSYALHLEKLGHERVTAPGLDNMAGIYVIMQTAKRCKDKNINVSLYCVSTVQEELGARGALSAATAIEPHIAIAVDTTLAADTPGKMNKKTIPDIQLGKGPSLSMGPNTSPPVFRQLYDQAKQSDIPFQIEPNAKPEGNDAKEMQLASSGTATGSVGIPLRNMHTQTEIISMHDVEAAVDLLTEFVACLSEEADFLPINHSPEGKKIGTHIQHPGLFLDKKNED